MAALTWRDVAAPNFGSGNDMLRTSAQLQSNALAGLGDALKQFRAERTNTNTNQILSRSLQVNDYAAFQRALTGGTFLSGIDPSTVDPKVFAALSSRARDLLSQSATRQDMSQQQNRLDRTIQQEGIEDAARATVARQLGNTDPTLAALPIADQQGYAKTRSGLVSDQISQQGGRLNNEARAFNNMTARRDDAAAQSALGELGGLLSRNATTDDLRRDFEETPFSSDQARMNALAQLERVTGQRLYAPTDAPATGPKGTAPVGSGGTGSANSTEAQQALSQIARRVSQNSSVGVVADIEKNLTDTRSAPEVATEIGKLYPEVEQDKLTGMITEAMAKNPNLSAADVGSAITRSTTSNWLGSTRFADGLGVDDSAFKANLESLNTGKADYLSADNQRVRKVGAAISKADENLNNAKQELIRLRQRATSQTSIDTSRAEDKVERMQKALDDIIAKQQASNTLQPIYQRPPTQERRRQGERGRANNQRP